MAVFADLLPFERCVGFGRPRVDCRVHKVRFKYRAIGGVEYFPIAVDILTGFAVPLILVADFGELVFGDNGFDLFQGWMVLVMDEQVELLVGATSGGCENFLDDILDESFAKDFVERALDKDWAVFRKRIANNQSCVGHFEIV